MGGGKFVLRRHAEVCPHTAFMQVDDCLSGKLDRIGQYWARHCTLWRSSNTHSSSLPHHRKSATHWAAMLGR
ncbi:hypothetical protein TSUKUMMB_03900 [Rhodococcus sp. no. 34]